LIDFENFICFKPGRSTSCSSCQCCRTQLVLQLRQLHHLLIRFGLGDNLCQSSSVSRSSFCLNQNRARRRGRPAAEQQRHWHPYVVSGPAHQLQMPHDLHGDTPGEVDASITFCLALSRQKRGRSELTVASSLRRARTRSSLRCCPPKFTHSSAVTDSPSSAR